MYQPRCVVVRYGLRVEDGLKSQCPGMAYVSKSIPLGRFMVSNGLRLAFNALVRLPDAWSAEPGVRNQIPLACRQVEVVHLSVSRFMRNFNGGIPVLRVKNFQKTDWSAKPRMSAISFMSLSENSSILRASAHSNSEIWKYTVRPVVCFTMRDKYVAVIFRLSA